MKNLYSRITNSFRQNNYISETSKLDIVEQYKINSHKIHIENQPFRLSGLLHILTNKISAPLQMHRHQLYYDIDKNVSRYIIGDNDYIEQILEPLLHQLILLNYDSEIIINISKYKEEFIVFDLYNPKGVLPKTLCKAYKRGENDKGHEDKLAIFTKAKNIAEAMGGSLTPKSSAWSGTHVVFKLPYIKDENSRSHQEKLKEYLSEKRALFVGETKHETKQVQYIFDTYNMEVEHMVLEEFDRKKPNLNAYFIVILHSNDLLPKHINYLKMLQQYKKNTFKLIVIHRLFEENSKIERTNAIADAELYTPIIIGDVEEILYQMFILNSKAVKETDTIQVFDPSTFVISGNKHLTKTDMEYFKGAHIAVAEDSKIDQRIMRNILDIEGVELFMVSNGQALIELLEKEDIDIVFLDINMPVMDGLTATKIIRSELKWKKLPIISISSMAFGHEIRAMKLAGMNASVAKPISAQNIYQALERFLKITPAMQARYAKNVRLQNYPSVYRGDSTVLDVIKGIEEVGGKLQYIELLNETLEVLKDSQEEFTKMVMSGEYAALKTFAQSMVPLYSNIHASEMTKMFKEILVYLSSYSTKGYLSDYISLYDKNRQRLEEEAEAFKETFFENTTLS